MIPSKDDSKVGDSSHYTSHKANSANHFLHNKACPAEKAWEKS